MSEPIATETALTSAPAPADDNNLAPPAESVTSDAVTEPAVVDQAPSANGETAAPPAADDAPESTEPAAKPRKSAEERIREAIAEREFWKRQALSGQQPPAPKQEPPAAPALPEKPPAIEDFEDVNAWGAALAQYHRQQAELVVEQKLGKVREQQQVSDARQAFDARQQAFQSTVPDYVQVVSDPDIAPYVTPEISGVIVRSELGPQMSYHLGRPENRNELVRISQLPSAYQLYELGKLEARLAAAPKASTSAPAKPKPVQQTRAPAPPSPVGGANAPSKRVEDMSPDEYMAHRASWANYGR